MKKEIFYTDKEISNKKIAIISDIHYYFPGFNIKIFLNIIKQIKKEKPDYICICGDIIDSSNYTELSELENFLNQLALTAPIIAVLGNHDEKSGRRHNWTNKKNNVLKTTLKHVKNLHLLEDKTWKDKDITFYGFNPSFEYYEKDNEKYNSFLKEVKELNCPLNDDTYNVTLIHTPINIYKYLKNNKKSNLFKTDLILSGHMHNGLLPNWLATFINKKFNTTRGFYSPTKQFFPKYAHGRINDIKDGYVYEGITKLSKATGFYKHFNWRYNSKVKFIYIEKKEVQN